MCVTLTWTGDGCFRHRHVLIDYLVIMWTTNTDLPPWGRGSDLLDGCISVELHSATPIQVLGNGFWKRFHPPSQGPLGPRLLHWPLSQRTSGDHRLGACRLENLRKKGVCQCVCGALHGPYYPEYGGHRNINSFHIFTINYIHRPHWSINRTHLWSCNELSCDVIAFYHQKSRIGFRCVNINKLTLLQRKFEQRQCRAIRVNLHWLQTHSWSPTSINWTEECNRQSPCSTK